MPRTMTPAFVGLIVVLFASTPASAAPFTFAYADGNTLNGSGLVSDSGPDSAAVYTFDLASAGYLSIADTHGEAGYGMDAIRVGLLSSYLQPFPDAEPNPIEPWDITVSYALQVLSGSTWVDVIQSSIHDSEIALSQPVDELLTGRFEFEAGVPYEIRSFLGASAAGGYAVAGSALSEWDDLFTFSANAPVDFSIKIVGSVLATHDGESLPISEDQSANIDLSARLQTLRMPTGIELSTASETSFPVNVPEPPISELLLCGLAAIGVHRMRLPHLERGRIHSRRS